LKSSFDRTLNWENAVIIREEDVLEYHRSGRKGKLEVSLTKPCSTQRDLSLAYTPGVAVPCLAIKANREDVYEYTVKGNLVAVVTNGTAVLGLGDIGPEAGKPVMEGKAVLFKKFADIDVFDIELNAKSPEEVVRAVQALEPTFGGINLEDIKAPDCFYVEEELRRTLKIPVFHDDQHGTAIISAAALLNALEITGKDISKVKVVYNGAGAAAIACAHLHLSLGVRKENVVMCDSKGVISRQRSHALNGFKEEFLSDTSARTLAEAMEGADVFIGLSVAGVVTKEMVRSMAPNAIIFALANPDPEISYEDALDARSDIIMATGRSDYPNQVNNVLGFPFIFRGALDVRATVINEEMKIAAAKALAALAKQDVPDSVIKAYAGEGIRFGPKYILPKPVDPRVLTWVAPAVARAAIATGVARTEIVDWDQYRHELEARLARSKPIMQIVMQKAQRYQRRIVFPEGESLTILRACQVIMDQNLARPVLIGSKKKIEEAALANGLDIMQRVTIVEPSVSPELEDYVNEFFVLRQRKGATLREAQQLMLSPFYFAAMMVRLGHADGLIGGVTAHYREIMRSALQVIGMKEGTTRVCGMHLVVTRKQIYFFADTTVNFTPTAEELADIAMKTAAAVRHFDVVPRLAMLSSSDFGSAIHPESDKVRQAVEIVKRKNPELMIDGEMQADTAVVPEIIESDFPFSTLKGGANVLIFPNLDAANIAYQLMGLIGEAELIGPILMGMAKPVHVLDHRAEVAEVVNITAVCAVESVEG
jgi:malate dehydrogenase (oxaloacetate-decarboxylating)(NADP+)